MILVIFGAGASYDSVPTLPPVPGLSHLPRLPLADGLFSHRDIVADALSRFPDCLPIISLLQSAPHGETVEHTLEVLSNEAETDSVRKQQMAAIRFYLHFMMWNCDSKWNSDLENVGGTTNYITLLDQLRRSRLSDEPVCLVNFNYDLILERALRSVGVTIENISDYIAHDEFKLYKIHGSVNWAREVDAPEIDLTHNIYVVCKELIDRIEELEISENYRVVTEYPIGKSNNLALFPAIAIPVETKRVYECPDNHLESLRAYLPEITKILSIGWRGTEQHFLGLLKESLPDNIPFFVVAGEKSKAYDVIREIKRGGLDVEARAATGGFSDFVVKREAERFLSS